MVWEMTQNHRADTTREALSRVYGSGETLRRFEEERRAAGGSGCTPVLEGNEVPRQIGLLLVCSTKVTPVLSKTTHR